MNLIFLGPPGAGKGTVATRFSIHAGIPHISTGDIFREAISTGVGYGKQVREIVEGGGLASDDLTVALVKERLSQADAQKGFILDGFPRTIGQAVSLREIRKIDWVVSFVLDNDEVIKRLAGRRVHKASGRTYHILFKPPRVEGKDDLTGEDLIIRPDDCEESIITRLEVYQKQTVPLINYYQQENILFSLDSRPDPDTVFTSLSEKLF